MLDPCRVFPGVMERFDKVSQLKCAGIRWFRCPAHSDDTPSGWCFVHPQSKMLVLKCFRGCNQILIMRSVGLHRQDIHMEGKSELNWVRHATYDYNDSSGQTVFRVIRLHGMDGNERVAKKFIQQTWTGTGWRDGIAGLKRPLYRQPELLAAPTRLVWLTEGEGKCDLVRGVGLTATTLSGGSNASLEPQQAELLSDRRLVLCLDNDEPGRHWAEKLLFALLRSSGPPKSVSIMEFPELPRHGDIGDVVADFLKLETKDCVRDRLLRLAAVLREIRS